MNINDSLYIPMPFIPDMITAYKFGLCELCKKEKDVDSNFDNSKCPHCHKKTKIYSWASKS